jgi:hypothetical protein
MAPAQAGRRGRRGRPIEVGPIHSSVSLKLAREAAEQLAGLLMTAVRRLGG